MPAPVPPIENLIAFILNRRAELNLTQRQVAKDGGLNPGTLANIEMGRVTKAPSLGTLEKLAAGLRADVDLLIKIARGELAAGGTVRPGDGASRAPKALPATSHPPRPEELHLLDEASAVGLTFRPLSEPAFWQMPPEDRRHAFRYIEGLIDVAKRLPPKEKNRR